MSNNIRHNFVFVTTLMTIQLLQLMLDFTFGLIDKVHTCTCTTFRKSSSNWKSSLPEVGIHAHTPISMLGLDVDGTICQHHVNNTLL